MNWIALIKTVGVTLLFFVVFAVAEYLAFDPDNLAGSVIMAVIASSMITVLIVMAWLEIYASFDNKEEG